MGWRLNYTPASGKYISTPVINIPTGSSYEIEFQYSFDDSGRARVAGSSNASANNIWIEPSSVSETLTLTTAAGAPRNFTLTGLVRSENNTFRIVRTGASTTELFVNGISQGVVSLAGSFAFTRFFISASTTATSAPCELTYFKVSVNGSLIVNYDATASGGTGGDLPDTVNSANNGTQSGTWPADNSEWVFYDAGGSTDAAISYDIGAIDFAVSAEPSAPDVSASISYDIGEISFSVSASSSVPVFGASVGYDIGVIDFSVSASAFAPDTIATVSYDIGVVEFSVSASSSVPVFQSAIAYDIGAIEFNIQAAATAAGNFATIAYDIGAIDFNVSADSSVPVVSATASYDIGEMSFSIAAAASAPGSAAMVSFDIGEIVFAVSASATGPVPQDISATIGYDIGAISFSVSATVTGIGPGSGVGYGVQFTEPPRGFTFTEPPRGFTFTEPPRGVQF